MKHEIENSYIKFFEEDGEIIVENLYVVTEARGQKLGHKLLDVALEHARSVEMNLALYAEPQEDGALETNELVEYYRDYGFESDSDCNELMTYYV